MFEIYIERLAATEFLAALKTALKSPNLSPLLLHVWGVGGVGKSTLSRRAAAANPQAAAAYVEFERTEGATEPIGVMRALHQQLKPQFGGLEKFGGPDAFAERYREYFEAIHKLKTESPDGKGAATAEQIETVKKGLVGAAKGIGGLTPVGSELAGITAEVVVETSRLIASEADRLMDLVQRHRATKGKRELQELILAPVPRLTDAFVQSLSRWSKQRPILLRLDTYEKAPAEVDNWLWLTLLGNHAELRELPVRILVMGRHEILRNEGWRKLNQDRPGWIDERSLQKLDSAQTQDYLQRIGITDATQIERIYKITRGLPYYLNWIRDKQQKGEPLVFAEGNEEIAKLLLQGLDKPKRQMIELAACCRWFDQRLLESICAQHQVTAEFDWLVQQSFVERLNENYRLDDVARDVFRREFCRSNPTGFEQVFDLLMRYFKALSDQEVPSGSAVPDKYENSTWRKFRTEYLYYLLFVRKPDLQHIWLTHLLEARYFNQDVLVQVPLQSIDLETIDSQHPQLKESIYQFLQKLRPAILHGWAVLEEYPINYEHNEKQFGLTPAATQKAIELCLSKVDELQGLAKFAALFYRSRRCPESERFERLMVAKAEADKIVSTTYPEFRSSLFLLKIGLSFSELGREEEAISSYDKAIEFEHDNYYAWYLRGLCLLMKDRMEEAVSSYDKAIKIKCDNHKIWYFRGHSLYVLGRYDEAISSYEKSIALKPDDPNVWYNLGHTFLDIGRNEEAISSFDRSIALRPDNCKTWHNRGVVLSDLGRREEAISSYDKAIELKPDSHEAWNNRGNTLYALGRNEEAISSYDKAIELKPDDHGTWYARGAAFLELGHYEEAILNYNKAIELNPDYHEAWCSRGNALVYLKQYKAAVASYEQAIVIKPDYEFPHRSRGYVLKQLGRHDEALESFSQVIAHKPDDASVYYNKACCYALQGDVIEAVDCLSRAIALDPEYREMAKTDADFDAIQGEEWFRAAVEAEA